MNSRSIGSVFPIAETKFDLMGRAGLAELKKAAFG